MRKKLMSLLTSGALLLSMAGTALAHDGWVQTNTPIVRSGEMAFVDLQYGNHSNDHASYRIAGKWNMSTTKAYVITPDGSKIDVTASVFDTGEATELSPEGQKGYHALNFVPGISGAYVISVEGDGLFTYPDGSQSRTLRSAKTFVAAADLPLAERVTALTAFGRAVSSDRTEWLPLVNPVTIAAGDEASFQLSHGGQPVANEAVTVIRRSNGDAAYYRTDETGVVTFKVDGADHYLVRAKYSVVNEENPDVTLNYESTLTFVSLRGVKSGPAAANLPLTVQINGTDVAFTAQDGQPEIVSNRTFVPFRKVAETLGATVHYDEATQKITMTRGNTTVELTLGEAEALINGETVAFEAPVYASQSRTMVPLRLISEAFGAHVEWLPAAGGAGVAVLINLAQ